MATVKSTSETQTSGAKKAAAKKIAKTNPPPKTIMPIIQPAAVVVPEMSVVGPAEESPAAVARMAKVKGDHAHVLKKQEILDRIVKASGAKKKDIKLILEAALTVLGDALSAGEELHLQPLGKIKVNKQRNDGNAEVLILKLRRGGGNQAPKQTLAEGNEAN